MTWKYKVLLILFRLIICAYAQAQLNESDTFHFQLRAAVSGNYQSGNVDLLAIRSKIDFTYAPLKNIVFKSQNSNLYQEFSNRKADNDLYSRNYLYWKPEQKLYPFGMAYISGNYRRKVNLRFFAGGGLTYQLLQKKQHVLKLSASVLYENNLFKGNLYNKPEYNGSNLIRLWRGALYAGGWNFLLNNHLRIYYDAYWLPAFTNKNNYRTQYDIGVDFPIRKGLNFSLLYTFTHENVVITTIRQQDKILSFGFSYNFKQK
jgi:Protein of unknown function, DUF481